MDLLRSDLARNFGIGFVVGALIVMFQVNPDFLPAALAATLG